MAPKQLRLPHCCNDWAESSIIHVTPQFETLCKRLITFWVTPKLLSAAKPSASLCWTRDALGHLEGMAPSSITVARLPLRSHRLPFSHSARTGWHLRPRPELSSSSPHSFGHSDRFRNRHMTSHDLVRLLLRLMGDSYSFFVGLEVKLIIFRAATDDLCQ